MGHGCVAKRAASIAIRVRQCDRRSPLERTWPVGGRVYRDPACLVGHLRLQRDGADRRRRARAGSAAAGCPDRKSVVEGKSVAVRVDLGGRRIINKKKETKIRHKPYIYQT